MMSDNATTYTSAVDDLTQLFSEETSTLLGWELGCDLEVYSEERALISWILGEVDRADENGNQKDFRKNSYQLGNPRDDCS